MWDENARGGFLLFFFFYYFYYFPCYFDAVCVLTESQTWLRSDSSSQGSWPLTMRGEADARISQNRLESDSGWQAPVGPRLIVSVENSQSRLKLSSDFPTSCPSGWEFSKQAQLFSKMARNCRPHKRKSVVFLKMTSESQNLLTILSSQICLSSIWAHVEPFTAQIMLTSGSKILTWNSTFLLGGEHILYQKVNWVEGHSRWRSDGCVFVVAWLGLGLGLGFRVRV